MSGAQSLLELAGKVDRATVYCPHPEARASCTVVVQGTRRSFASCPSCKAMFEHLIAAWHGGELGPGEVVARMRAMGYTRRDGAWMVFQLAADGLKLRLGFRARADL